MNAAKHMPSATAPHRIRDNNINVQERKIERENDDDNIKKIIHKNKQKANFNLICINISLV